jgi:hypothetical protein
VSGGDDSSAFRLPPHFQAEEQRLCAQGLDNWASLAALDDGPLRQLARAGGDGSGASEARLIRLRGQARLVVALGVLPEEAALLLYAGIATAKGLAEADPERLRLQIGRLQRQLLGPRAPLIDFATVRSWIHRARQGPGRSAN